MKLHTREWGSGDKVAVLIHGIVSDSRAWWRVGPALAERGYRVIAVDLLGHGESPRCETYSPQLWGDSLIESVPSNPDVAIGHSLGGLTLAMAVERLMPGRAIYSDPAFRIPEMAAEMEMLTQLPLLPKEMHQQFHPGWSEQEIDIELETLKVWDPATTKAILPGDYTPPVVVPSLVQLADSSMMVSPEFAEELRAKGFEVRIVEGAEHTIHRHLFDDFMSSLEGWI